MDDLKTEEKMYPTLETQGFKPTELTADIADAMLGNLPKLTDVTIATSGSLKLMDGKLGGAFHVRYLQDDVKKHGWLELIIVYPDNTYKTIVLYKNALRMTQMDDNGVYYPEDKNGIIKNKFYDINSDHADWYALFAFEAPNMPIPAPAIWTLIKENYESIPVVKIHQTAPIEQVYLDLRRKAAEYAQNTPLQFMDAEDKFFIHTADFNEIAEAHGWNPQKVRVAFDTAGLLITDKAPFSYQYSKRIQGKVQRFYVLKKALTTQVVPVIKLTDTSYQHSIRSQEEKRIKELESQIKKLTQELCDAAETGRGIDAGVLL